MRLIHAVFILLLAFMTIPLEDCSKNQLPSPMSGRMPKDLFIFHDFGACHAEWGRTEVSIDANGQGLYEEGSGGLKLEDGQKFENEIFKKTFVLNETELLGLLDEIDKCGFYNLNDSYHNPEVYDGYCEGIAITRNNTTKSVHVSNIEAPQAYERTAKIIIDLAWNKTHSQTFEPLILDLNDKYSGVRRYAAEALGEINDIRAVDPLIRALSDNDSDVRRSAAEALGKLNETHAVEPLIRAAKG
jgi:hypothetical protein